MAVDKQVSARQVSVRQVSVRAALAAAVVATLATSALAQYRVDNSQVRDASNRIGSGGFNGPGAGVNRGYNNGNLIVTGNVSNGRAFRGSLGYTDQSSFRGNLGSGDVDRFYRDSVGVGQIRENRIGAFTNQATNSQPFFGPGQTVARPPGFQLDPATGGYVLQQPRTVQSNDGRIDYGGALRAQVAGGALSESTVIGGAGLGTTPVGAYLERQRLDVSEYTTLARPTFRPESPRQGPLADALREPRDASLARPAGTPPGTADEGEPSNTGRPDAAPTPEGLPQGTLPQGELPQSTLPGTIDRSPGSDPSSATPGGASATGQRLSLRTSRAAAGNSQYAELQGRYQRQQQSRLPNAAAAEQVRRNNEQVLKNRAAAAAKEGTDTKKSPTDPTPGAGTPTAGAGPSAPRPTLALPTPPPQPEPAAPAAPSGPLEIKSLTAGAKDPALKKTLGEAETLMKAGKFTSAIDAFDRAEAIAGDDPLVFVGRGIAELGGGYYRNAEGHFRQAFAGDPALLLAKFDLREMLTAERLNFLLDDLGRSANNNKNDPGPLVLLAFIYYHSNLPERAQKALDLAQQRAGGKDELAKLLQENWTLPAAGEGNK